MLGSPQHHDLPAPTSRPELLGDGHRPAAPRTSLTLRERNQLREDHLGSSLTISSVRFRHDMRSVSRVVIDSSNYNNANPKFMSDTAVSGLGTAILIRHYTLVVRPHIDALITKYGKAHGYELKYMPKAQRHWVAVYLACHIAGTFYTKLIDLPKRHLAFPATGIEFAAAQGAYQCAQVLATSLGCKYGQPFLQLGS